MKILFSKTMILFGLVMLTQVAFAQNLKSNDATIGPPVNWIITTNSKNTNVLNEEALFTTTNAATGKTHLWFLTTQVTNLPSSSETDSDTLPKTSLQLMFEAEIPQTNNLEIFPKLGPHYYHGSIFYTKNWRIPTISKKRKAYVMTSADYRFIVMTVEGAGLIYCSHDSGISWNIIHKPGKYWFRLSYSPQNDSGFFALATIFDSTNLDENQTVSDESWYSVSSEPSGNKLALTGGGAKPAPVLSIAYLSNQVTLSWSDSFTNFIPQENFDLSTTNWVTLTNTPTLNSDNQQNEIILSATNNSSFFRLIGQ
jgi:hypothetical protein